MRSFCVFLCLNVAAGVKDSDVGQGETIKQCAAARVAQRLFCVSVLCRRLIWPRRGARRPEVPRSEFLTAWRPGEVIGESWYRSAASYALVNVAVKDVNLPYCSLNVTDRNGGGDGARLPHLDLVPPCCS